MPEPSPQAVKALFLQAADLDPAQRVLFLDDKYKTIRLWDAATGEECATIREPGTVWVLAFSPDSTWLVAGGDFEGEWLLRDPVILTFRRGVIVAMKVKLDRERLHEPLGAEHPHPLPRA